jgi:hypothetical protein
MASLAAEHLTKHLEATGFVLLKKQPAKVLDARSTEAAAMTPPHIG